MSNVTYDPFIAYTTHFGPLVSPYHDNFDFTLPFENTVLSAVPSTVVLVAGIARIYQLWLRPRQLRARALQWSKLTVLFLFVCIQFGLVVAACIEIRSLTWTTLLATSLSLVTAIAFCVLSPLEHTRNVRPSSILLVYLFLSTGFDVLRLRTLWFARPRSFLTTMFTASTVLKATVLVLEACEKTRYLPSHFHERRPEETSSILNRGIFFWLNRLMLTGARSLLVPDNLFELDSEILTQRLSDRFTDSWQARRLDKSKQSVLRTLLYVLRWSLLRPVVPRIVLLGFTLLQPVLLQRLLQFLQQPDDSRQASIGRGLVAAYSLAYLAVAVSRGFYWHTQYRMLTMMRGCLVSALQWQTGRLHLLSVKDPKAALTLMSSDIESVTNGLRELHELWANAIQIAVAGYLLSAQLGVAALAPVAIACLTAFCSTRIGKSAGTRQPQWMSKVEQRVSLVSSIVPFMKEVRMKGLSDRLTLKIRGLREEELRLAARFRKLIVMTVGCAFSNEYLSPAAAFLIFYVQADGPGRRFDSARAFTSLTLIMILATPLNTMFQHLPRCMAAYASLTRIQDFLVAEEQKDFRDKRSTSYGVGPTPSDDLDSGFDMVPLVPLMRRPDQTTVSDPDIAIRITDGCFGWESGKNVLHDINISIPATRLTCIIGPVACGKSTLCKVFLGEPQAATGKVELLLSSPSIAFCDQTAYLTNTSIRDNIVGYADVEEAWYDLVLWSCALNEDISSLSNKDNTLIGTNGVNLSGGQRHKVALARALYSRNSMMILDDIFSGLDANSAEHIFRHVIGPRGLARKANMTVIFATHTVKFLPLVDHIVVLNHQGRVTDEGSYSQLHLQSSYVQSLKVAKASRVDVDSPDDTKINPDKPHVATNVDVTAVPERDSARQTGDFTVYRYFFNAVGTSVTAVLILLGLVSSVFCNTPSIWLKVWTDAVTRSDGQRGDPVYVSIYAVLQILALVFLLVLAYHSLITVSTRAGNELHLRLLRAVMRAPLSMFGKTDVGALTNRFSQDINLIDEQVSFALLSIVFTSFLLIGEAIIVGVSSPWTVATSPVVLTALYFIQKFYLRTSRQLRLLDIEAKSPLYTHFMETITGLVTLRAFNWTRANSIRGQSLLDESQKPTYLLYMIQRWLSLVLDTLVACLAAVVAGLAISQRSSSGFAGVALSQLMAINLTLNSIVAMWTELETSIGAVSRIKSFTEQTGSEHKPGERVMPPESWPAQGRIEFRNVTASYSETTADEDHVALKNMSFAVSPGEKVGICGRSGSGKSSTILALFRMIELQSGTLYVDDVDLSTCPREIIRSKFNPLPQHPFFMNGSVRMNLDPFDKHSDEELVDALDKVSLKGIVEERGGLNVDLNPEVLSHGQRQLFALAGAILRKDMKVVVLDEVTSNVDSATDAIMQKIIREEFAQCTIIAVAHRLDTIADFDKVIVMDHGSIVEIGDPQQLLRHADSQLRRMWDSGLDRDISANSHTSD